MFIFSTILVASNLSEGNSKLFQFTTLHRMKCNLKCRHPLQTAPNTGVPGILYFECSIIFFETALTRLSLNIYTYYLKSVVSLSQNSHPNTTCFKFLQKILCNNSQVYIKISSSRHKKLKEGVIR